MTFIAQISEEQAKSMLGGRKLPKPGKKKLQQRIGASAYYVVCAKNGVLLCGKKKV